MRGSSRDPRATPFSRNRNTISNLLDTYYVLDPTYLTNSPTAHPAHTSQPTSLNSYPTWGIPFGRHFRLGCPFIRETLAHSLDLAYFIFPSENDVKKKNLKKKSNKVFRASCLGFWNPARLDFPTESVTPSKPHTSEPV